MNKTRDHLNAYLDLPEAFVPHAQSGPLAGLTLAVKDIFDVAGYVTGRGNPRHAAASRPALQTAPAVQQLLDAGARFVGKTQTDEFAFSLMGQNDHFEHVVNPAAPERVTGGSSSGSAAAVAGGLADIATGSDTGGSIRAPASFCGLIGLRTTHGAISLDGTMPLAPSLDTFGWFARDMDTYEKVARVLLRAHGTGADANGRGVRLLALPDLDALVFGDIEAAEYRRMAARVAAVLGEPTQAASPPFALDDLYWCFRRLQAKEAWAAHGSWVTDNAGHVTPAVRDRIGFGATVSLNEALAEGARRKQFRSWLEDVLEEDGVLVLPTVPGAAPLASSPPEALQTYRDHALKLLCWSGLSGFPQITIPLGAVHGAPFGISLLGPAGSDLRLIGLARRVLHSGVA